MDFGWPLIVSLALNGVFVLWLLLKGPESGDRYQLQCELTRAHREAVEEDERHRLGLSADRAIGRSRWDESFQAAWRARVLDWQAEAERQGLQWLVPMKKEA